MYRFLVLPLLVCVGPFAAQLIAQTPESSDEAFELSPLPVDVTQRGWNALADKEASLLWLDDQLGKSGGMLLDQYLAESPAFSLYRREPALSAHPTTQGVSLRRLGPTAASRSLVLLDGVPQNDPFGGWVTWSRYVPGNLATMEILPNAKATLWGQFTAGGAIRIERKDPLASPISGSGSVSLAAGAHQALEGAFDWQQARGAWGFGMGGHWFETDGDFLVPESLRGSIDQRAELRARSLETRVVRSFGEDQRIEATFAYFDEERGNGSPLARNSGEGTDWSLRWQGQDARDGEWEGTLYFQERNYTNQFTALNDDRTAENPVLHQFGIPGQALGASLVRAAPLTGHWSWLAGADFRALRGETREDFSFGLDDRRIAGGKQLTAGAFGGLHWEEYSRRSFTFSFRADAWRIHDGFRRESTLPAETVVTDLVFPDRDHLEPSFSASWSEALGPRWGRFEASFSRGFRLPTINELYRPYRVGADIFAEDPALEPERFSTVDLAWTVPLHERLEWRTAVYTTWIENAIANVFVVAGPTATEAGFVPAGGSLSRRANIPESWVRGWENALTWHPSDGWVLRALWLWQDATFEEVPAQPTLEEKAFPLTAAHRWRILLRRDTGWGGFSVQWSGESEQYDDPLNQRRLPGAQQWDGDLWWQVNPGLTLFVRGLNLTDREIVTGLDSSNERSIAPGRAWWIGLKQSF
jgi:outer membrane receptor protein involved in Fe transport